jgi:DNA-binding HxlR family transcriptional regulator
MVATRDVDMANRAAPAPASSAHDADVRDCREMRSLLEFVGRRWIGAVLFASTRGARRFGEYRHSVVGISDRLLSQRRKELESLGLVEREVIATTPVQVLYRPTTLGVELIAALRPLLDFGARHLPGMRSQPGNTLASGRSLALRARQERKAPLGPATGRAARVCPQRRSPLARRPVRTVVSLCPLGEAGLARG